MIDEKLLIEKIKQNCDSTGILFLSNVEKIINKQPKVGEWIPCSERLAEGCSSDDVVAWMPLPEVYKA